MIVKYIISYDPNIPNYSYNFFESFEIAEAQRIKISKSEGKVLKIVIYVDN